jgi:excisionase family DNA binding protein
MPKRINTSLLDRNALPVRGEREVKQVAWPVPDWAQAMGVGRSKTYELMKDGVIDSVLVGRRRLIITPPDEFIRRLASQQI